MGQSKSKPSKSSSKITADKEEVTKKVSSDDMNGTSNLSVTTRQKRKPGELKKNRISFYETVDASEVLPYLIIGKLLIC